MQLYTGDTPATSILTPCSLETINSGQTDRSLQTGVNGPARAALKSHGSPKAAVQSASPVPDKERIMKVTDIPAAASARQDRHGGRCHGFALGAAAITVAVLLAACNDEAGKTPQASGSSPAASTPAAAATAEVAAPMPAAYTAPSADVLYKMVAPIALYPDKLVAQVLAGATHPDQVASAEVWLAQNPGLKNDALAQAANAQPWDPSIKSLTLFPNVLEQMASNIPWTTALGKAYYNAPADVLNAIQEMRIRANKAGSLKNSRQIKVTVAENAPENASWAEGDSSAESAPMAMVAAPVIPAPQEYIQISEPDPGVVYVPRYDPAVVYGTPMPVYDGYQYAAAPVAAGLLGFGSAVIIQQTIERRPWGWNAWDMRWGRRREHRHDRDAAPSPRPLPTIVYNDRPYMPRPPGADGEHGNYPRPPRPERPPLPQRPDAEQWRQQQAALIAQQQVAQEQHQRAIRDQVRDQARLQQDQERAQAERQHLREQQEQQQRQWQAQQQERVQRDQDMQHRREAQAQEQAQQQAAFANQQRMREEQMRQQQDLQHREQQARQQAQQQAAQEQQQRQMQEHARQQQAAFVNQQRMQEQQMRQQQDLQRQEQQARQQAQQQAAQEQQQRQMQELARQQQARAQADQQRMLQEQQMRQAQEQQRMQQQAFQQQQQQQAMLQQRAAEMQRQQQERQQQQMQQQQQRMQQAQAQARAAAGQGAMPHGNDRRDRGERREN
jgi:hypothetical protein